VLKRKLFPGFKQKPNSCAIHNFYWVILRYINMKRQLIERLDEGPVICAEGFLFEVEKRGYLASGEFVPMVALEHPEALENLHKDFQHAGSDIVQAFTYNGHREKMRVIGKEELLEPLNRAALKIAKKVADNPIGGGEPNLMSGNISNSNIWEQDDKESQREVESMFNEMVEWAVDEGADLIMGETFYYAEEAYKALEIIQKSGLPAVINIAPMGENIMRDGVSIVDTCKELEQRGADVVGMNCFRGPATMLPYLKEIREAISCHMAALPLPFRTTEEHPTFFNLPDNNGCTCHAPHGRTFPTALDPLYCNRYELRAFFEEVNKIGIKLLGVCCGATPMHQREVAEAVGLTVPASKYREKMENHFMYGTNERTAKHMQDYGDNA
jgi:betaine-homocysteine S-methyltransferase